MISPSATRPDVARLARILIVVVLVGTLAAAREILIPIALAILLAFVLAPVVERLQRIGVPAWLAAAMTVGVSIAAVAFVSWIVALQALDLASNLPRYREAVREKVRSLAGETDGWLSRAQRGLTEVREQVRDATSSLDGSQQPAQAAPVTVTLPPATTGPIESLVELLSALIQPLFAGGIVLVFTSFILVKREDLRNRALALAGADRLRISTQVIEEATLNVSRFLFAQFLINVGFGTVFAIGLLLIGVPNAILFGALVVPLRFVPIVGPSLAAALPTLLAMIVLDGWTAPLLTLGLFSVLETSCLYVIEPWAYGVRTGLSTPAVLLALVFWTWLWGAPGLVLAMPMTLCIAVLGRHLPSMQWITMVLNEQPALSDAARAYQRLLAFDADDALSVARAARDRGGLDHAYEDVLLPALALVQVDRRDGELSAEQLRFVLDALSEIVQTIADDVPAPVVASQPVNVLCVPARTEADGLSALMLALILRSRGHIATAMGSVQLISERAETVGKSDTATAVVICAMPPLAEIHARVLCQRIRAESPTRHVVVGLWHEAGHDVASSRLLKFGASQMVTKLADAVNAIGA